MKKVTIPQPIWNELFNRLEEMGAYNDRDEVHSLYLKVNASRQFEANDDEVAELRYHANIMVELGAENEGDVDYETEAKYATQLLKRLRS